GYESRHNKQYWYSKSVGAIGPNATGLLNLEKTALRYQWKTQSGSYVTEELSKNSFDLEKMYLGLRTSEGFNFSSVFSPSQLKKLDEFVPFWQKREFIHSWNNWTLVLTPRGFLMIDSVMDDIFREVDF